MPNIEIKARYEGLETARSIAGKLRAKHVGEDHQVDTYFKSLDGRLKLRESRLSGAQLIPYVRPNQSGPKRSEYLVIEIKSPVECKRLLTEILGIDVVVDKIRDIFLIDNVRVHLDTVKGLGSFFEFEAVYEGSDVSVERAEYEKVEALMKEFQIKPTDLIHGSYRELVKKTLL